MTKKSTDRLRVAAGQFAATTNLDQNLEACTRLVDQAAAAGADLVVLPEFANHISVYESAEHCLRVAVALDGQWMSSLRSRAAAGGLHVALAVTVPREDKRTTVTNVLIGARGEVIATADKQTLMGNERTYLDGGACVNPVAATRFGPVGIYACMDGVTFETPRIFAVRGARLMLNSLNSFALDEASLHIPVRAVENGVFVVAANKVGSLLPADQVATFSAALGVPPESLSGAGESQIVAPDGEVLAMAGRTDEELIVADIDLGQVDSQQERFRHRRPELYKIMAQPETASPRPDVPDEVAVRCVSQPGDPSSAASIFDGLAGRLSDGSSTVVVLPELTPIPAVIPDGVWLISSAIENGRHVGQIWTSDGLVHQQPQLHASDRVATDKLGDELTVLTTPWGDVALIVGDDHQYPESVRLAAIQGAHVAVVLWHPTRHWETDLAIRERAAENRLCVITCAPASCPEATMVLNPPRDSLWNAERQSPYNGTINTPDVAVATGGEVLDAVIYPKRSLQREISRQTDLVGGRPWIASQALL